MTEIPAHLIERAARARQDANKPKEHNLLVIGSTTVQCSCGFREEWETTPILADVKTWHTNHIVRSAVLAWSVMKSWIR